MRCHYLYLKPVSLLVLAFTTLHLPAKAQDQHIFVNPANKTIRISSPDKTLSLLIDYNNGCVVKQLHVKGSNTLSAEGIFTGITTTRDKFTSAVTSGKPTVAEKADGVTVSNITYGDATVSVSETWQFQLAGNKIRWHIARAYHNVDSLQGMAFPQWNFKDLAVWKGGILDNGGMVWCKYLQQANDTYGAHTGGVTFWNAQNGNALQITPVIPSGKFIAATFSKDPNGAFTCKHLVSDDALQQRYQLSRFVPGHADVFAPLAVRNKTVEVQFELAYTDYIKAYSRGLLPGIDTTSVRELMNTTGRYGVVDNNIIGANGWLTNWKCLHEPFFALIGLALDDPNYTRNMAATLDQERDLAMQPDGRVLSRWHNEAGDEMPGTYNTQTGYYEAMWGYTVDSQPGYVINTAEQFDLSGDIHWLQTHQASCERALGWLLKRDENDNGIFEMKNNTVADKTASDWLDIVWASYENAFVNAQLYEALHLWAGCEKVLGAQDKAAYYLAVAARLKEAFNKPVEAGGFWSDAGKRFVYWRDKDGTVHGNNLVTPVNFAAIAFGLCDDPDRISAILDQIETRTRQENLFHWPLCFDSFTAAEVSGGNWPFPKYENGDIFPTWGYLGVNAYSRYNKNIALKYINKLLQQYEKDGLSSQRYSRKTQQGLGDDILAGTCTGIAALYRDIYGVRPAWNRLGLEPHMSDTLNGTRFSYVLRDTTYQLQLSTDNYTMRTNNFTVNSKKAFGAGMHGHTLSYYPGNDDEVILETTATAAHPINLQVTTWMDDAFNWTITSKDDYHFTIKGLTPRKDYWMTINSRSTRVQADANGILSFHQWCAGNTRFRVKTMEPR